MLDTFIKFREKYSTVLKLYSCIANTISILKITKGHNSVNNIGEVTFLFSAHRLMMFYVCTKFRVNHFKVTEQTRLPNEL